MLENEFPFVVIPPLIFPQDKTYQPDSLKLMKQYLEKFLNEVMRHEILRTSIVFELFLSEVTQKRYEK